MLIFFGFIFDVGMVIVGNWFVVIKCFVVKVVKWCIDFVFCGGWDIVVQYINMVYGFLFVVDYYCDIVVFYCFEKVYYVVVIGFYIVMQVIIVI